MVRAFGQKPKGVRWGKVREIKHVKRVPGPAFSQLPTRLKHLAAWRRIHTLVKHTSIRAYGTKHRVRPSSNLSLSRKMRFIDKRS